MSMAVAAALFIDRTSLDLGFSQLLLNLPSPVPAIDVMQGFHALLARFRAADPFRIGLAYQGLRRWSGTNTNALHAQWGSPSRPPARSTRRVRAVGVPGDRIADGAGFVARLRAVEAGTEAATTSPSSAAPRAPTRRCRPRAARPLRTAAGRPPARRQSAGHRRSSLAARRHRNLPVLLLRPPRSAAVVARRARAARPTSARRAASSMPTAGQ